MCNSVAQTELIKATAAIESAVFVTTHWLADVKPSSGLLYTTAEELKSQVKKMGGFFQILIQVNTPTDHQKIKALQLLDARGSWQFFFVYLEVGRSANLSRQNGYN